MNTAKQLMQKGTRVGTTTFLRRPALLSRNGTVFPRTTLLGASRMTARQQLSTVASVTLPSHTNKKSLALGLLGGIAVAGLHSATGSQNDFFDYRFQTTKPTEELASFYGGEELMELFCVFPFVGQLMMRNGTFDEDGNVITTGIPGTLKVSMVFSEDENGKDDDTGKVDWFNKRERFRNTLFGWTCWDMVINFGFRTLEDGRVEVYHYGEYFHGNLPIVSQAMKLVFKTHARWLAWSTEHHINHYAFTAETEEEEDLEEESRKNMPLFLLKNYAWSDLMAMVFGSKEDVDTSFLVNRKDKKITQEINADKVGLGHLLPIQREATKIQISQDIAADRITTRGILARNPTHSAESLLTRRYTLNSGKKKANTYGVATEAARLRQLTRAATRRSTQKVEDSQNVSFGAKKTTTHVREENPSTSISQH